MKSISGITKETFLKAEDSKNRDAMLFDMLANIVENLTKFQGIKEDVEGFKTQVSLLKRIFFLVIGVFSAVTTWLNLK
jgi:hypothetical protein